VQSIWLLLNQHAVYYILDQVKFIQNEFVHLLIKKMIIVEDAWLFNAVMCMDGISLSSMVFALYVGPILLVCESPGVLGAFHTGGDVGRR